MCSWIYVEQQKGASVWTVSRQGKGMRFCVYLTVALSVVAGERVRWDGIES